jgi:hypothetical protein
MSNKKAIPKVLKELCWKKWVGDNISKTKCLCCEDNEIKMSSFHCGHVLAEVHGGKMSVENLRPVCAACNLSMGSENMVDFKTRCGFGSIETLRLPKNVEVLEVPKVSEVYESKESEESKDSEESKNPKKEITNTTNVVYQRFSSISEIPKEVFIPNIQRNIIKEHVESMRKHIQEYTKLGKEPIFGTLDFVLYDGAYYLVDGQHRYTAIQKEYFEHDIVVPLHVLVYEVISAVTKESAVEEIFKVRNKGIPVPKFMLSIKESKKDVLKEITTYLETLCPAVFKHKGGLVRPKININTFIEHFRVAPFFRSIATLEDFIRIFTLVNQECFERLCAMDDKQKRKHGITENMIEVWTQNKIYIGYNKDFTFFNDLDIKDV